MVSASVNREGGRSVENDSLVSSSPETSVVPSVEPERREGAADRRRILRSVLERLGLRVGRRLLNRGIWVSGEVSCWNQLTLDSPSGPG